MFLKEIRPIGAVYIFTAPIGLVYLLVLILYYCYIFQSLKTLSYFKKMTWNIFGA